MICDDLKCRVTIWLCLLPLSGCVFHCVYETGRLNGAEYVRNIPSIDTSENVRCWKPCLVEKVCNVGVGDIERTKAIK
jgi:hypothetical protein